MKDTTHMRWLPAPGFSGLEVSEYGDVRRVGTMSRLKGGMDGDGYVTYHLKSDEGRKVHISAHRLVALAFLGPPPSERHQAAHRNGSRLFSHPSNLRWSTPLENHDDRRVHGTGPTGKRNPKAKITDEDVVNIRREYQAIKMPKSGRNVAELDERYGLHRATIIKIAKGKLWSHIPMEGV